MNNVLTGVQYDIWNQAKAEHRLEHLQAKLRRDAERGNSAAVDRDARRVHNLKYRIVVDEWLIRKNLLYDPGYYPYPVRMDPISCAAIAQATSPAQIPYASQPGPPPPSGPMAAAPTPGPTAAAPTITITIVNAEPAGIAFAIDGVAHHADAGSRQDLAVAPDSNITYDGGGSLGQRRYRLSPGLYEFRSTAEVWALYKLPGGP